MTTVNKSIKMMKEKHKTKDVKLSVEQLLLKMAF